MRQHILKLRIEWCRIREAFWGIAIDVLRNVNARLAVKAADRWADAWVTRLLLEERLRDAGGTE
ncbi:hypothetical protein GCM10012275_28680 [Longimycelium tulufanense]|uniref:Uncharacterized protein n=1 Tax=Longimycelium tulufanense TaxID=907463 RepID=A0A8J3CEZ6_9PSEU|nr:hypothetical protein [Longimycelium tulufanense]GGM55830.1 hypothetical protein GCM10012275_28680 [Longimycelium tulufanense]